MQLNYIFVLLDGSILTICCTCRLKEARSIYDCQHTKVNLLLHAFTNSLRIDLFQDRRVFFLFQEGQMQPN